MKSLIIASLLSVGFILGACSGTTSITPAQVIAAVETACAYSPLASDILAIENANQQITNANQIADLICTAITTANPPAPVAGHHVGAAPTQAVTIYINGKPYQVHVSPKA